MRKTNPLLIGRSGSRGSTVSDAVDTDMSDVLCVLRELVLAPLTRWCSNGVSSSGGGGSSRRDGLGPEPAGLCLPLLSPRVCMEPFHSHRERYNEKHQGEYAPVVTGDHVCCTYSSGEDSYQL